MSVIAFDAVQMSYKARLFFAAFCLYLICRITLTLPDISKTLSQCCIYIFINLQMVDHIDQCYFLPFSSPEFIEVTRCDQCSAVRLFSMVFVYTSIQLCN